MLRNLPCVLFPICLLAAAACSDSASPTPSDEAMLPAFPSVDGPAAPAPTPSAGSTDPTVPASPETSGEAGASNGEGTPTIVGGVEAPATPPVGTPPGADVGGMESAPPDMETEPPVTTTPGEQNSPTPITPSQGCANANANPPIGQLSMTIRGARADYLVTLPTNGYSGSAPVPLIFGFHGRNRTYLQFQQVDASQIQTQLGSRAVMVYPQSQGGPGWNFPEEVPPSIEFFDALYPQILASYCVDTSHVFAVGHSSGGYFSHILGCRYGEKLRGIGVVSGQLQEQNCVGNVAAIMVHSPGDVVVPFAGGQAARDYLIARNACSQASVPGPVAPCVSYQGCSPGLPVAWCQHNEPTYQDKGRDTFHGWPSFASQAMASFFFALP